MYVYVCVCVLFYKINTLSFSVKSDLYQVILSLKIYSGQPVYTLVFSKILCTMLLKKL